MNNMFFLAFEKIIKDDPFIVIARERFYIDKMEVIQHGINKNRTNK
jgi:hypothetical protein